MANSPPTIAEEAGLGPSWVPIDVSPIIPGKASPPPFASVNPVGSRYLQGSSPSAFQHDTHFVDTETQTSNAPKYSLMPLSLAGSPIQSASIQSIVRNVPAQTTSSGGGFTSAALSVPSIFNLTGSPASLPAINWIVTLASEPPDTVFAGPSSNILGFDNATQNAITDTVSSGHPVVLTLSSVSSVGTPWAFVVTDAGGGSTVNNPAGWTSLGGSRGFAGYNSLASNAVSFTETITAFNGSTYNMVGCMALFGSTPTIVQTKPPTNATSLAFSSNTHAGNIIIVAVNGIGNPGGVTITDTQGNTYQQLAYNTNGGTGSQINFAGIFITSKIPAAACTVTATYAGAASSQQMTLMEVQPFPAIAAVPTFRRLQPQDIPPIQSFQFAAGTTGTGAVVLASAPTLSALGITGTITTYNNIATVSGGVPAEYAKVDLTAQAAAITATTLYAVPVAGAGMYRISWVATVTTPDGTSSTLGGAPGFQIVYTDNDDSVVKTSPAAGAPSAGVNQAYSQTNQGNTTASQISGTIIVNAKASTNIQYQIGYTSSGGTMRYNLHIKLEAM